MLKKLNPYWVYALKNVQLVSVVTLIAALVVGGFAIMKGKAAVQSAHTLTESKGVTYSWSKTQLTQAEYEVLARNIKILHPAVQVTYTPKEGLVFSVQDGAAHADWLYALSALHARDKDIVWEATDFCVGRCQGSVAARAKVLGYRQTITAK